MRKFYALALTVIILLVGCSEDGIFENKQNAVSTIKTTRSAGDGVYDVLGFGYDITGEYLDPMSVRNPILNIEKYKKDFPNRLIIGTPSFGYDKIYYGYSAFDYIKNVTETNNVNANFNINNDSAKFSGSFTKNPFFGESHTYSSKYSFASLDAIRNRKYLRINDDISRLSQYLSEDFKEDLDRYPADKIIELYGTNVLTDFIIGGRYKLIFKSAITKATDTSNKKNIVKLGFNAVLGKIGFGINTDQTVTTDVTSINENQNKELYVQFYGGNGTNMKYDLEKAMPTTVDIKSWEDAIQFENANLTQITWERTYPIYEFISDPVKKEEIKNAVTRYLNNRKIKVISLKAMYEMYEPKTKDRYYVFSWNDVQREVNLWKAEYRHFSGYILENPKENAKPMYEMYDPKTQDRYYVFSWDVVQREVNMWGAQYRHFNGYILDTPETITKPMYEMYDPKTQDRYYVFSWDVVQTEMNMWGAEYRHLSGYIYQ